jgi:hypothetical protein
LSVRRDQPENALPARNEPPRLKKIGESVIDEDVFLDGVTETTNEVFS